ncbi:26S proteasome complex subunit DSS1 [Myotis brandtii]|uniref:26S proteasome complex subunit SEM1 n=1 Tax=Myotis brandtii TaxID=109478 RepID=S7N9G7_MYOBR|nr:26S proteasome complex subunit DSS1 [Myotis brandtii]
MGYLPLRKEQQLQFQLNCLLHSSNGCQWGQIKDRPAEQLLGELTDKGTEMSIATRTCFSLAEASPITQVLLKSPLTFYPEPKDWTGLDEDEDAHVWEDNWDDDNVEDDFSNQLRAELEKHGYKMETS